MKSGLCGILSDTLLTINNRDLTDGEVEAVMKCSNLKHLGEGRVYLADNSSLQSINEEN